MGMAGPLHRTPCPASSPPHWAASPRDVDSLSSRWCRLLLRRCILGKPSTPTSPCRRCGYGCVQAAPRRPGRPRRCRGLCEPLRRPAAASRPRAGHSAGVSARQHAQRGNGLARARGLGGHPAPRPQLERRPPLAPHLWQANDRRCQDSASPDAPPHGASPGSQATRSPPCPHAHGADAVCHQKQRFSSPPPSRREQFARIFRATLTGVPRAADLALAPAFLAPWVAPALQSLPLYGAITRISGGWGGGGGGISPAPPASRTHLQWLSPRLPSRLVSVLPGPACSRRRPGGSGSTALGIAVANAA